MECRVCAGRSGRWHVAREMMHGLREEFDYFECGECGCLQIAREPEDLGRHYPAGYAAVARRPDQGVPPLRAVLYRARARRALGEGGELTGRLARWWLGPCVSRIFGEPDPYEWLRKCGARRDSRILDVGCGGGMLLLELRRDGFRNLAGVDPFIEQELDYGSGLRVRKASLEDVPGGWDVIMMHHSLEHVWDPRVVLEAARDRLRPGGHVVVRMPMVDSEAWRQYGVDWVQLDAPRHLTLHTRRSLERIAEAVGLDVIDVEWDSGSFQFWGSEQYRRDVPLLDPRSVMRGVEASPFFSEEDIRSFERRAEALNREGRGDQACFILRAAPRSAASATTQ